MENIKDEQNMNFGKLGTSLKVYGGILIIGGILSFFIVMGIYGAVTSANTMEGLIQAVEGVKFIFTWAFIVALVNIFSLGFIIKELFFSAKNTPKYQTELKRSAFIFSIGLVLSFIVNIYAISYGTSVINELLTMLNAAETVTAADIDAFTNRLDATSTITGLITLIPSIAEIIGYVVLYQFGSSLSQNFPQNPAALNISKGFMFALIGTIISSIIDLIGVGGLLGLVGLILLLVGLFKAGNGFSEFNANWIAPTNITSIQTPPSPQMESIPIQKNESKKTCPKCGAPLIDPSAKFCSSCGNQFY